MRFLVLFLAASLACAQQPAPIPNAASATDILAELQTKVDARKAKVGDHVRLKLLHALVANGKVIVPQGASLVGHVTEVAPRTDAHSESRLAITLDRAEWKHNSVPFEALIVRHARMVRRIVQEPVGARPGDSMEADLMRAPGGTQPSSAQPQTTTRVATTTTAPAATPSAPTQPTTPTSPPSQPPSTPPASSSSTSSRSQSVAVAPPSRPETIAGQQDRVEARYMRETMLAPGPRAVDVAVRPSTDPRIGSVFMSTTRDVVLPKGILLVLKQSRTGQP